MNEKKVQSTKAQPTVTGPWEADRLDRAWRVVRRDLTWTPLIHSRDLSDALNRPVFLKCENRQVTGSFKARGALNSLASMPAAERARGVATISAGNHAQAVAWAAVRFGVHALVVMPEDASPYKVEATRSHGAEVVLHGNAQEAFALVRKISRERGLNFVHPFDSHDVVYGHATCGTEIFGDLPDVACVVVPVGGGGLVSGIALANVLHRVPRALSGDPPRDPSGGDGACDVPHETPGAQPRVLLRDLPGAPPGDEACYPPCGEVPSGTSRLAQHGSEDQERSTRIWGVEPRGAAAMKASLVAGRSVGIESPTTVADGLAPPMAGELNHRIVSENTDGVELVRDQEIIAAMDFLARREKLVVEPSGAAAVAALLSGRIELDRDGPTVAVLTGGNIDLASLARYTTDQISPFPVLA